MTHAAPPVAEIKLRAERKAGELLKEIPKAPGGQPYQGGFSTGNTVLLVEDAPPTLSDLGISKMQSSRFQAIASIPEPVKVAGPVWAAPLHLGEGDSNMVRPIDFKACRLVKKAKIAYNGRKIIQLFSKRETDSVKNGGKV